MQFTCLWMCTECARVSIPEQRHTSSLSLPIKSSSGWASCRLPLLLWTSSFPISIFSWSPWPCPRLGECGWDRKVNTSSCRVSWGSDPSLLSQLLQTCRSQDKPCKMEPESDSAVVGETPELSSAGLQLSASKIKDHGGKQKQVSLNLSRSKFYLSNIHCCTWILMKFRVFSAQTM